METKANLLGLSEIISEALENIEALIGQEIRNNAILVEAGVVTGLSNFSQGWFVAGASQQEDIFSVKEISDKVESGELAKSDMVVLISNQDDNWANKKINEAKEAYRLSLKSGEVEALSKQVTGQVNGERITLAEKPTPPSEPETRKLGDWPKPPKGTRDVKDGQTGPTWGETFIKWLRGDDL